jgi:F420-0:gamma-glutamyl ligase
MDDAVNFTVHKVVAKVEHTVYTCTDLEEAEAAFKMHCELSDTTSMYEVILKMDDEICKRY